MQNDNLKHEAPTDANNVLVAGCFLTFNGEIISEGGRIIAEKGQKVEVEEVLKNPGFWGKRSGQWYDEKIYGVKLKGYRGEWRLSAFVETSIACH
jgi:hypothetical protein